MNKFENDFQKEMEEHLLRFKTNSQYLPSHSKKAWLYNDFADNLFPPIRHGFLQHIYDEAMPLHDYINHVRSSQAYCINVFYPVLIQNPGALLELLGSRIHTHLKTLLGFEFEYSPDTNVLGEWKSDDNRPEEYVTAVDLKIDAQDNQGRRVVFLVEVKFTESSFTPCGGFDSGRNTGDMRRACTDAGVLTKDSRECYLQGANGKGKLHRTYFKYFDPLLSHFNEASFHAECPFIHLHQCLRNHALVRHHRSAGDSCFFVLLHHEKNESIVLAWKNYLNLLQPSAGIELLSLTGQEVIDSSGMETLKAYYRDRYTLAAGAHGA